MVWEKLKEELIISGLEAKSSDDIFEALGGKLVKQGYCKEKNSQKTFLDFCKNINRLKTFQKSVKGFQPALLSSITMYLII